MSATLYFGATLVGAVERLEVSVQGHAEGDRESWRVTVPVIAATPSALEQQVQTLEAALATPADLVLKHADLTIRSLVLADCRAGPSAAKIEVVGHGGDSAHPGKSVRLRFDAIRQDSQAAIQSNLSTVEVQTRAGQPDRLVIKGRAILRAGEAPEDHEGAVVPALASGYRRTRTIVARDTQAPSVEYEVEDEQVFRALPADVEDGHYYRSVASGSDGRPVSVTAGFFVGTGAKARALELSPDSSSLLSSNIKEDAFARRVDFEFVEAIPESGAGDVLPLRETLSYTTTRRVVDHAVLQPGAPAYRQEIGSPFTELIQEGRAFGRGRHVAPPIPRHTSDVIERRVKYSFPSNSLPPAQRFETRWRYVVRSVGTLATAAPEA